MSARIQQIVEDFRFETLKFSVRLQVLKAITPQLDRANRAIWELQNPRTAPGRREQPRENHENAHPV